MKTTVGELVRRNPQNAVLFTRLGIDFCCNGNDTLEEAASKAKVDVEVVEKHLQEISVANGVPVYDFDRMTLSQLIDHILEYHHEYIYAESETIKKVLNKVCSVHGEHHPELAHIKEITDTILDDLPLHQHKEEMVLFPFIKQLESGRMPEDACFGSVASPIMAMEADHRETGARLFALKKLTGDFTPPADGCESFALLYRLLREMFENIQQHVHLENNFLHPKAIAREKELNTGA
jgi:regulator of cell morphogenesis and NO signaling